MPRLGIRINLARAHAASAENTRLISAATALARASVGWPLNLGSNPHLSQYLYGECGFPVQKDSHTHKPTIGAEAIAKLRIKVGPPPDLEEQERHGLSIPQALERVEAGANPVLEARVIYAWALQEQSHYIQPALAAKDGRFYPQFLIHAQASGRWSTNHPPLAQLPDYLEDLICPDEGWTWLGWDWKQIEPRILDALVKDEEALARWDEDRYARFTGIFFPGTTPEHPMWTPRRKFTKTKILKLHYGGDPASPTPGAVALGLNKKLETQASLHYLASRPKLAAWRLKTMEEARRTGLSRTFLGRLRRLSDHPEKNIRAAFDHPMQGAVSDIFNLTYLAIKRTLPWLRWVYGKHDSQIWSCPQERVQETWPQLKAIVEREWDVQGVTVRFPAEWKERAS